MDIWGIVVGAAIVRAGQILVAQRSGPPALRGLWELPGGKVEVGETESAALVRECREELAVTVVPARRLTGEWPVTGVLADTHRLRIWICDLPDGEPQLGPDHLALAWLAAGQWDQLAWLPSDRPVLPELAAALAGA